MAYIPNFRKPVVPFGNIIPEVHSSSSERPWLDSQVANWLPLGDTTTNRTMGFIVYEEPVKKDFFVITPGKLVGITRERISLTGFNGPVGRLVPAGIKLAWEEAAGDDVVLQYKNVDVERRTEDLATGTFVAGEVEYTKDELTAALQSRGLLKTTETLSDFVSEPVGIVPQAQWESPGGDGTQPSGFKFHNYNRGNRSQILCDYVLTYPLTPSGVATTTVPVIGTVVDALSDLSALEPSSSGSGFWILPAVVESLLGARYGAITNENFIGLSLGRRRLEVAPHLTFKITRGATDRTDLVLVRKKNHINELTKEGDYFVDLELGIIFFYEAGGDGIPVNLAAADVVSGQYLLAFSTWTSHLAHIRGDIYPGQLLTYDKYSNFAPFVPRPAETDVDGTPGSVDLVDPSTYTRPERIVGQALTFSSYPRDGMDKVHTWYSNLPTGVLDKMPGSATGGFTDQQTYTGSGQYMVLVNLLK
jgi:hypothetical protein